MSLLYLYSFEEYYNIKRKYFTSILKYTHIKDLYQIFHPFYNWRFHQIFFKFENAIWLYSLSFFTPGFFCFPKCTKSLLFLFWLSTVHRHPSHQCLWSDSGFCLSVPRKKNCSPGGDPQQGEATNAMFCTKLKDLKITGDCPFSLLAPGQVPKEQAEEAAGSSDSCQATLPICQDVSEKNAQGSLPQRKTSRTRVYLHTLAESICKLIFPEVSTHDLAILLLFWKLLKNVFFLRKMSALAFSLSRL